MRAWVAFGALIGFGIGVLTVIVILSVVKAG